MNILFTKLFQMRVTSLAYDSICAPNQIACSQFCVLVTVLKICV